MSAILVRFSGCRTDCKRNLLRSDALAVERAAWRGALARLGWPVCLTSTNAEQYSAVQLVETYHGQTVHERDFARLKSRAVHIQPVCVRDEPRIAGLVWLLMLALRVRVICEQRLRTELATRSASRAGLNPASRTQRTTRPTTERVLAAFSDVTLTLGRGKEGQWQGQITPLNATQHQIRALLGLPADVYAHSAHSPPKWDPHLCE